MPDDMVTMPDEVPSEDSINLPDEVRNTEAVAEEEYERRKAIILKIESLLYDLSPIIRREDADNIRSLEGNAELSDIIQYMHDHIPEVRDYLGNGNLTELSDDGKIEVIKNGLKARAASVNLSKNVVRNYVPANRPAYSPSRNVRKKKHGNSVRLKFF